jgi:hypothetical protein
MRKMIVVMKKRNKIVGTRIKQIEISIKVMIKLWFVHPIKLFNMTYLKIRKRKNTIPEISPISH